MRSGADLVWVRWRPAGSGRLRLFVVEEWLRLIMVHTDGRRILRSLGRGAPFEIEAFINGSANSDKDLAESNFKALAITRCWRTATTPPEPLAGRLRKGSATSNTVADHLDVLGAAIAALPPKFRCRPCLSPSSSASNPPRLELCQRSWTVSRVVDHAAVAAAW